MFTALKDLFTSKTTWLIILGSAVVTALTIALNAVGLPHDTIITIITIVGGLFGIKGVQQASADFGKNSK